MLESQKNHKKIIPLFLLVESRLMFECYPHGESIPSIPGSGASYSSGRLHSPVRSPIPRLSFPIGTVIIPHRNRNLQLQFQRYIFRTHKKLQVKVGVDNYVDLPTDEQTVISTLSDDILAIFDENTQIMHGLYNMGRKRVTFNMISRKNFPIKETHANKIPGLGRPFARSNFTIKLPESQPLPHY